MLESLRAYYVANGIAAEGFNCPHAGLGHASCRSVSKDFVTAREAFVGSEYECGTLPRVLFVSIDAASDHPGRAPAQRTLEYMRYWEENGKSPPHGCNPEALPKNFHWYRTHEFAYGEILRVGDRQVLRFRLFHPRAFGKFNKQRREAYGWYAAVATAVFAGGHTAAAAVRDA